MAGFGYLRDIYLIKGAGSMAGLFLFFSFLFLLSIYLKRLCPRSRSFES